MAWRIDDQSAHLPGRQQTKPHTMTEKRCHRDSFILRIWWEGDAQPIWRGWVQHAATGETRYFRRMTDLLTFIEGCTGSLAQAPDARPTEKGDRMS